MRRGVLLAAIALGVTACSTAPEPEPAPPVAVAPPPPARPRVEVSDLCGADRLQSLIGHPRTDVPVPIRPALQRVTCTTCPATMDYNPQRLNFLFDAATGLIQQIRCG